MKNNGLIGKIVGCLLLGTVGSHADIYLSFNDLGGGIRFSGNNTFSINTASHVQADMWAEETGLAPNYSAQWGIGLVTGSDAHTGLNSAQGLFGYFTGGSWTYGPVQGVETGTEWAAIEANGPSTFVIDDGSGYSATGKINWIAVTTTAQVGGGINANITDMAYAGTCADLVSLVQTTQGSMNLGFNFGASLSQLSSGSPHTTTFTGNLIPFDVTPVPEPTTGLMGVGALGLFFMFRAKRAA